MADKQSPVDTTPRLSVVQSPGNFFIFWNVVVPLTVLLNVRRFGLRVHEMGLILALLLNPFLLNKIIQYPIMTWIVVMFLIIWIERILRRWAWYKIYSWAFFRSLILLFAFIAVPSIVLTFIWRPLQTMMPTALSSIDPDMTTEQIVQYRDVIMLMIAMALLLHSIYFYSQCDQVRGKDACRGLKNWIFPDRKSSKKCKSRYCTKCK